MRLLGRQLVAILIAVTFFVEGFGVAFNCSDQPAPAGSEVTHATEGTHHAHDHDHYAGSTKGSSSAPSCLKRCELCNADPSLTRAPILNTAFRTVPAIFSFASQAYSDYPVLIEPGIPKHVV